MMDPIWLLLLLPLAGVSGWVAAQRGRFSGRNASGPKEISDSYVRSINFLANDQHDEALDVLAKALEDYDESLEIQLALGTLFRRRGEIEKATQIHQGLISRPGISSEQKSQVLFELANDYFKAGLLDRAENLLLELGASESFREASLRLLVQIYESEREWERVVAAAGHLDTLTTEVWAPRIAQYHCELAERALNAGDYAAAKDRTADALKLNRNCARAIILRGRPCRYLNRSVIELVCLGQLGIIRLMTWSILIYTLAEQTTGLEVRHVFSRHAHGLTCLGIPSGSGHPVPEANAAKSPNLNAISGHESPAHVVQYGVNRKFHVAGRQVRLLLRKPLDQFGFGHGLHYVTPCQ